MFIACLISIVSDVNSLMSSNNDRIIKRISPSLVSLYQSINHRRCEKFYNLWIKNLSKKEENEWNIFSGLDWHFQIIYGFNSARHGEPFAYAGVGDQLQNYPCNILKNVSFDVSWNKSRLRKFYPYVCL